MGSVESKICSFAGNAPEKVALIDGDIEVTYAKLWHRCLAAAFRLRQTYGILRGDRIILSADRSAEFIAAYFGIHIAGGICVPTAPDIKQDRFEHIRQSTDPSLILGQFNYVSCVSHPYSSLFTGNQTIDFSEPEPAAIADILYTTGTTSDPKGVMLSYGNISAAVNNINSFIGNTAGDIELLALPVNHSFGLGRIRCVLSAGGTLVLLKTFANVKRFFKEIERCGVTGFAMVPANWSLLKKISGEHLSKFSRQLKYIEIGSSFMPPSDKTNLMRLLPQTRICMHYGSTEASRSSFAEFHSCSDKLHTAGKASPCCSIRIYSEDGKILPPGEEGEVCVKGDHVSIGYWQEPTELFSSFFYDGYFKMGDLGLLDKEGFLYLKGRLKEIINVGGEKVSPMEVESVLNSIPGIKESACVGIPDPKGLLGEVVKAYIVSDHQLSDNDIFAYLKDRLEGYKLPVSLERVDNIPKTFSGKIKRIALKK